MLCMMARALFYMARTAKAVLDPTELRAFVPTVYQKLRR